MPGENIVQVIQQTGKNSFWRYFFAFSILTVNTFFTFWFWTKGFEARVFYGVVWLLGIYIILSTWLIDRANMLVVTTDRIFDIHRESIFRESVSAMHFLEVADVTIEKRGIIPTILNYGLISIYPKQGNFSFEVTNVKRPELIQNIILERKSSHHQQNKFKSKEEIFKQFIKNIPEFTESELTLAYQKINNYLLSLAESGSGKTDK